MRPEKRWKSETEPFGIRASCSFRRSSFPPWGARQVIDRSRGVIRICGRRIGIVGFQEMSYDSPPLRFPAFVETRFLTQAWLTFDVARGPPANLSD